jgi:hypothetical protein
MTCDSKINLYNVVSSTSPSTGFELTTLALTAHVDINPTIIRLFSYVRNLKLDVVLKASRAVVIGLFSLNEAPLGLF